MQENAVKYGKSPVSAKVRFYFRDLKKIFLHPYIEILLRKKEESDPAKPNAARSFINFLEKQNLVFVSFAQIQNFFSENDFPEFEYLESIFSPWQNQVHIALESLLKTIETIRIQWNSATQKINPFEKEILFQYTKIIKRILSLAEETKLDSFKEIKTIGLSKELIEDISNLQLDKDNLEKSVEQIMEIIDKIIK